MSEHDNLLIAEYDAKRADDAFAALVRQHLNLVFATALRQVGDAGAAEEITQNVFITLAKASGRLKTHPTIAGWLYQTTLNKSREWLRSELRRRHREEVAVHRQLADAEGDSVWSPLVPLLDEALLKLREPDRLAVIMHFMEGQTFEEVGSALGVGEDTARKRVNRCLHELTHFFQRRGFAIPTLTAATPLFALASHPAPASLAASTAAASLAAAHSASTSTLTLLKGALKIMAWTHTKTAIVAGVAVVIIGAGTAAIAIKSGAFERPNKGQSETAAKADNYPQIFTQGINSFEERPNLLLTYPADDETTHRYVQSIVNRFHPNLDPKSVIKSDREITEADIRNCNIIIYGSPENHSLLQRVCDQLPIRFEDNGIVVGRKKYLGRDVGAIFTCPNPLAPNNRLLIYGTVSPEALQDMNAIFHGPTDFIVFNNQTRHFAKVNEEDRFLVIGGFDKSDPLNWRVDEKLEMSPPKILQRATSRIVVAE